MSVVAFATRPTLMLFGPLVTRRVGVYSREEAARTVCNANAAQALRATVRAEKRQDRAPAAAEASRGPDRALLKLANLLPPLDDLPEVEAVWSRIRKRTGPRNLAKGVPVRDLPRVLRRIPSQWLEGPVEFKSSLPTAPEFMKKAKAAGLTELVSLRPGTEEKALLKLAQQVHFVLAGLARRPRRDSVTWVNVAYEIKPQRAAPAIRVWNPFTRFTEALQPIQTNRLRRCSVCNQFFYAIREDARCCSRKCSHTRRQHRFTGNWERYRRAGIPDSGRARGCQGQGATPLDGTERGVAGTSGKEIGAYNLME